MTLKKTLSFVLTLALVLSVLAPCGMLQASAAVPLYGSEDLIQVTEPVIGESYYLAASTGEEMIYFRHGAVTETVPYSLATSRSINHNWCVQVTLEDSINTSEKYEGGFMLTYINPTNNTLSRIYCMDALQDKAVAGQTGIMDTGVNTSTPYKNRHVFEMADLDGLKVLKSVGNGNVLVAKQMEYTRTVDDVVQTGMEWRILGVPEAELANEGVYPVMLLTEHNHSYGEPTVDAANNTVSRTCSCGHIKTVYDQTVQNVDNPVVGNQYYLTANVEGTIRYFIHGTVTESAPASLRTSDNFYHNWAFPFILEAPVEGDEGFQLIYTNPNGNLVRIYCYDSIGSDDVADTGANSKSELDKHTFTVDGGYIKSLGNDHVLVVKMMEFSRKVKDADGNETVQTGTEWRILGVPEAELGNEGVYPVFLSEKHTHIAYGETYQISDEGHSPICWCGGYAEEVAHTYGEVVTDSASNTHSRSCTVCGYTNVIYGYDYQQANFPVVGNSYYLAANVNGQLMSFLANGGYTGTTPYSLNTSTAMSRVTLNEALEEGKGEFQLVADDGKYIYSVSAGAGATTSNGYITAPEKVSFFMDEVNGQKVIRAYGTKNILVIKYSEAKAVWRMWTLPETELGNEGVYPVVLLEAHEHTYGAWSEMTEDYTQTRTCTACGHVETMMGANNKVIIVEEPVIGESYYLVANADGKLIFFRHGVATDTAPYSLVATDNANHNWVLPVTIEDPTTAIEGTSVGFQMTYTNPSTGALARIYCYEVLKDTAEVPGQTGVMDTGINSANYKGRHTFQIAEVNGMKVLKKLSNNNILVVKYNETKGEWRMLGVPAAELDNEGVYPVMLANRHVHTFGETYYGDTNGHWTVCACGSKSKVEDHIVDSWTVVTHPTATEPGSKTGTCTACGETVTVETPVIVDSWNIVPGDDIGVNFVLALTEGDTVQVKVDGEEVPVTLADNKDGTYNVLINVAAAQMTAQITIVVNGQAVEKTYSVREYADTILADAQYTDYAKTLIKNMLNYGAAAQNFFNYNVKNLANAGITVDAIAVPELMALETSDNLDGIDFYGANVVMENRTAVRFYFTADSVEGLTFYVDGNVYEVASKGDKYYVEVAGIEPQNYDDLLNLSVTDGTDELAVAYSPLHYITRMYRNGSDETKAVAQAMYGYYMAAKTYYANLNLSGNFTMTSQTTKELYEGVDQLKKTYIAAGYGEVEAYIVTVAHDANVELKVSAGAWDESNTAENPAETKTVVNHFRSVKNAGNNVLAMINGGFFDLNTGKTMKPLGTQVVDGAVKQAPDAGNAAYGNNWFGMTKDGKYVISDAAGYESTYTGNVKQAVGGGKLLIVDGIVQNHTSEREFRTAVGITSAGDLVMVCVEDATYNDVCQIFVDMNMDVVTVLNLDGGGSTTMCIPGAFYPKTLIQGDDGLFAREVADAIAIVAK